MGLKDTLNGAVQMTKEGLQGAAKDASKAVQRVASTDVKFNEEIKDAVDSLQEAIITLKMLEKVDDGNDKDCLKFASDSLIEELEDLIKSIKKEDLDDLVVLLRDKTEYFRAPKYYEKEGFVVPDDNAELTHKELERRNKIASVSCNSARIGLDSLITIRDSKTVL